VISRAFCILAPCLSGLVAWAEPRPENSKHHCIESLQRGLEASACLETIGMRGLQQRLALGAWLGKG
jgi:hypothetical protein